MLRTPLNAVIGYSDMLMGGVLGPVGSHAIADAVTAINEAGQQVLSLVEELIDLARLEENASDAIDERSVDLDYVQRDAWRSAAPEAARRGTSLKVEIPPATSDLRGDEWAVKRVVQVLLHRRQVHPSRRYSADGGGIRRALRRGPQRRYRHHCRSVAEHPGIIHTVRPHCGPHP